MYSGIGIWYLKGGGPKESMSITDFHGVWAENG
jgi:hypothetical protein